MKLRVYLDYNATRPVDPAVLNACQYLQSEFGLEVTVLLVDRSGQVDPEWVRGHDPDFRHAGPK